THGLTAEMLLATHEKGSIQRSCQVFVKCFNHLIKKVGRFRVSALPLSNFDALLWQKRRQFPIKKRVPKRKLSLRRVICLFKRDMQGHVLAILLKRRGLISPY